ncbi:exosome non-catalytic core subunit rrp4, partial [Coelomomyces lativittatus]
YSGDIGDVVVGRITEIGPKRWKVNIHARQDAVLQLSAIPLPGAPFCIHCRRFKPYYEIFANSIHKNKEYKELQLGRVDCAANYQFCVKLNVSYYPSWVQIMNYESEFVNLNTWFFEHT